MESIENSVFQIFSEETYVEYTKPWTISGHGRSSGTGFAVRVKNYISMANSWGDLFIMTNAHVVEHATYITVRKNKTRSRFRNRPRCQLQMFQPQLCRLLYQKFRCLNIWKNFSLSKIIQNTQTSIRPCGDSSCASLKIFSLKTLILVT